MTAVFEGIRFSSPEIFFYFIPAHGDNWDQANGSYACDKSHLNFY